MDSVESFSVIKEIVPTKNGAIYPNRIHQNFNVKENEPKIDRHIREIRRMNENMRLILNNQKASVGTNFE